MRLPQLCRNWCCVLLALGCAIGGTTLHADEQHPADHVAGVDVAPQRIGIGDQLPAALLEDSTGALVDLRDFAGQPLVLVFFMENRCTGCMQQLVNLGERAADFTKLGARIVAISADQPAGTQATIRHLADHQIEAITVLGDPGLHAIQPFGVQIPDVNMSFHSVILADAAGVVQFVARGDVAPGNLPSPAILLMEMKRITGS